MVGLSVERMWLTNRAHALNEADVDQYIEKRPKETISICIFQSCVWGQINADFIMITILESTHGFELKLKGKPTQMPHCQSYRSIWLTASNVIKIFTIFAWHVQCALFGENMLFFSLYLLGCLAFVIRYAQYFEFYPQPFRIKWNENKSQALSAVLVCTGDRHQGIKYDSIAPQKHTLTCIQNKCRGL